MAKVDCNICCDSVSDKNIITCNFCNEGCCKSCTKRYLLDTVQDPHCMSCRRVWNRDFLMQNLPKTWVDKDLKKHRENVLFDRERSMMPATQPAVERTLARRETEKQLKALTEQKKNLRNQLKEIERTIYDLQAAIYRGEVFSRNSNTEKGNFTRKCPAENCKGFLNGSMKCGICESVTCKHCNEIISDENHECDPEAVETMKILKKDTKPCPSCGTMISKVSGCDQMWCPSCQNAFSWRTGAIERGVIHNPHYYEYQRNNPNAVQRRNFGDYECGGMPRPFIYITHKAENIVLRQAYRTLLHIQAVEFRRYRVNPAANNEQLRILYMLNELTDDEFKSKIQKKEKERAKFNDIYDVLTMVHNTGAMYMREVAEYDQPPRRQTRNDQHEVQTIPRIEEIKTEMERLRLYANTAFKGISDRYSKCKVLEISPEWKTIE